jgi:adenosine deaminase
MKNIHILNSEKPSRLHLGESGLVLCDLVFNNGTINSQHLYITSNEEIKEGDWFFRDGSIHKCFRVHRTDIEFLTSIDSVYCGSNTFWSKEFCQKIILTTDVDLIKDGVQAIDDKFLEWFVKNQNCEFVKTYWNPLNSEYDFMIPKEEPKQTVEQYEQQGLEKYAYEFQQETLEEAAEKYVEQITTKEFGKPHNAPHRVKTFIDGAKWQAERMYSEEYLVQLLNFVSGEYNISNGMFHTHESNEDVTSKEVLDKWFKQFKKK